MNHVSNWMNNGTGGAEWLLPVIGIAVVVLLVIVVMKLFSKKA